MPQWTQREIIPVSLQPVTNKASFIFFFSTKIDFLCKFRPLNTNLIKAFGHKQHTLCYIYTSDNTTDSAGILASVEGSYDRGHGLIDPPRLFPPKTPNVANWFLLTIFVCLLGHWCLKNGRFAFWIICRAKSLISVLEQCLLMIVDFTDWATMFRQRHWRPSKTGHFRARRMTKKIHFKCTAQVICIYIGLSQQLQLQKKEKRKRLDKTDNIKH